MMRIRWARPMRPNNTLETRSPRAGQFMMAFLLGFDAGSAPYCCVAEGGFLRATGRALTQANSRPLRPVGRQLGRARGAMDCSMPGLIAAGAWGPACYRVARGGYPPPALTPPDVRSTYRGGSSRG